MKPACDPSPNPGCQAGRERAKDQRHGGRRPEPCRQSAGQNAACPNMNDVGCQPEDPAGPATSLCFIRRFFGPFLNVVPGPNGNGRQGDEVGIRGSAVVHGNPEEPGRTEGFTAPSS